MNTVVFRNAYAATRSGALPESGERQAHPPGLVQLLPECQPRDCGMFSPLAYASAGCYPLLHTRRSTPMLDSYGHGSIIRSGGRGVSRTCGSEAAPGSSATRRSPPSHARGQPGPRPSAMMAAPARSGGSVCSDDGGQEQHPQPGRRRPAVARSQTLARLPDRLVDGSGLRPPPQSEEPLDHGQAVPERRVIRQSIGRGDDVTGGRLGQGEQPVPHTLQGVLSGGNGGQAAGGE